jgi:hypothetical protein
MCSFDGTFVNISEDQLNSDLSPEHENTQALSNEAKPEVVKIRANLVSRFNQAPKTGFIRQQVQSPGAS